MAAARPPTRRRLSVKLLVGTLLPTVLALGCFGVLAHVVAERLLEDELGKRLEVAASGVAAAILPEQIEALADADTSSLNYANVQRRLETAAKRYDVRRAALVTPTGTGRGDSEERIALGQPAYETEADRHEMTLALAGRPSSSVLFLGHDGRLYKRAYAPVGRPGAEPVALAMVEGSTASFAELVLLRRRMAVTGGLALALVVAVTWLLSRRLTGPLERLAEAAARIGRGELTLPVPRETDDELGFLARTLDDMRAALAARDERMQMMLAGIAHEVRNPLGGISLFAGLLREALAHDPERLSELQRIEKEVGHLETIVSEFLAYARRPALDLRPHDVHALLAEVAALLPRENLTVEIRAAERLTVTADGNQLRRSLLNLAKNGAAAAEAHHAPGKGALMLSADERGDTIVLRVSDDGPGVPVELRDKLFTPFFTTKEQGTGLGLAFARETARAHGGEVVLLVERTSGAAPGVGASSGVGGATFEIRLPKNARPQQDGQV